MVIISSKFRTGNSVSFRTFWDSGNRNYLPATFAAIGFIGWFVVLNILSSQVLTHVTNLPFAVCLTAITIVTLLLAVFGYNMVHRFEGIMTMISAVVFIIITVMILRNGVNFALPANVSGGSYWSTFFLMFMAAFSYGVGYSPYAADYCRYLDPKTPLFKPFIYTTLGLFVSIVWIEIIGVMCATVAIDLDPIKMIGQTMGWFSIVAYIVLILGAISANVLNIYSGSLATLTLDIPLKRLPMSFIIAGVSFILCLIIGYSNFTAFFETFLLFLSYWVTPWLGIQAIEFYFLSDKGKKYNSFSDFYNKKGPFGNINYRGLGCYVLGIVCSIPFMAGSIYTGPIGKSLGNADFSFFIACIISGGIYYLTSRKIYNKIPNLNSVDQKQA